MAKQLWFVATLCGFAIGWILGWIILDLITSSKWLQTIFWAYPAGGAGLGMGVGQWSLIRRIYRYAYLWIPITMIGFIASTGAALTLVFAIPALFEGSFFSELGGMVAFYTPIAPIALLFGPLCQWLVIRDVLENRSAKEVLKISVGWLLATCLLFAMFYLVVSLTQDHSSPNLFYVYMLVMAIPSGVVFAQVTKTAIRPLESNTSGSL